MWEKCPKESLHTFEELKAIFSIDQNYRALRLTIRQANGPCIPYIGMYSEFFSIFNVKNMKVVNDIQLFISSTRWIDIFSILC